MEDIGWLDREVGRCVAAILSYNDKLEDGRERQFMRHAVLDQLELLRHRLAVHLGQEPAYTLELPGGEVCSSAR